MANQDDARLNNLNGDMRTLGEAVTDTKEDDDVKSLIDRLEEVFLNAKGVPFTSNCMVDREEVIIITGMLKERMPLEIRQAAWLLENSNQMMAEARGKANNIISEAQQQAATMIDEHGITMKAKELSSQMMQSANVSATKIRNGALDYADSRLTELEEQLTSMLLTIQKNKKELR